MPAKKLVLNRETLSQLAPDDLRRVGGAAATVGICATLVPQCVSDFFVTVCECLTRACPTSNCWRQGD